MLLILLHRADQVLLTIHLFDIFMDITEATEKWNRWGVLEFGSKVPIGPPVHVIRKLLKMYLLKDVVLHTVDSGSYNAWLAIPRMILFPWLLQIHERYSNNNETTIGFLLSFMPALN